MDGLVKAYGGRRVVDGVSLRVPRGAIVALLGPNGAGKTTTVECIEGFRRPDAGTVRVLGVDPARRPWAVAERAGVMLQEGGAYQAASPREMLALYARLYRDSRDPEQLLETLGLAAVARTRYRALSGGERQRLSLALALVGRPSVVLLDEPTAGMDPQARRQTWSLLAQLRSEGAAVLVSTHLLDEAERLADEVVVLAAGRVVARGTPAAIAGAPDRLLLTTPARLDVDELATGLDASVEPDGAGRYLVDGGPELLPQIVRWFETRDLPLAGVTSAAATLEDAYLRLTAPEGPRTTIATGDVGHGDAGAAGVGRDMVGEVAPGGGKAGQQGLGRSTPRGDDRRRPRRCWFGRQWSGRQWSGRRVGAQTRMELRLALRNGENLLVTLGIPVGLLGLLTTVDVLPTGDQRPVDFLLPGMLALAVMGSAMVSLAIATGFERGYLVLKRLGATPLRRGELIAAKLLAVAGMLAVQAAVLLAAGAALGFRVRPAGVAAACAGLALGTAAFAAIGLAMAGRLRATATLALANALFVLLLLTSGIVFPLDALPQGLASVAAWNPAAVLAGYLRAVLAPAAGAGNGIATGAGAAAGQALAVLGAWAVGTTIVAVRAFRWE